MKLMIFYNQEKSAYVATISYTLYKRGEKEEVGSLVEEKKAILKGDLGQLCVD